MFFEYLRLTNRSAFDESSVAEVKDHAGGSAPQFMSFDFERVWIYFRLSAFDVSDSLIIVIQPPSGDSQGRSTLQWMPWALSQRRQDFPSVNGIRREDRGGLESLGGRGAAGRVCMMVESGTDPKGWVALFQGLTTGLYSAGWDTHVLRPVLALAGFALRRLRMQ